MTILFNEEDIIDENIITNPEEDPESVPGIYSGTDSGEDYNQLIYEYLTSKDFVSGNVQRQIYVEQVNLLEDIHTALNWNISLLLLIIVLFLFRSVRSWTYKITGGLKDVL